MARVCMCMCIVLVLGLFAGAQARAGIWGNSSSCTVDYLAARTAQACAAGVASRPCCAALRAPGDGGVPCVCIVAEKPSLAASRGLNVSRAAELFAACGGGVELATACHSGGGTTRLSHLAPPATKMEMGAGCDTTRLADEISDHCDKGASASCCEAVVTAVDIRGCLCAVTTERSLINVMAVTGVLQLYQECGGIRPLSTDYQCEAVEKNEEPSCSPPPPQKGSSQTLKLTIAILVILVVILVVVLATAAWALYNSINLTEMRATVAGFSSAAVDQSRAIQAYIASELAVFQSSAVDQSRAIQAHIASELARLANVLRISNRPNVLQIADRPYNQDMYIAHGRPREIEFAEIRGPGARRFSF